MRVVRSHGRGGGTWPLRRIWYDNNRANLASEPGFGAHCWDNRKQNASLRWFSKTTLNRPRRGRRATVLARERGARTLTLQDPVCGDWFRCFGLLHPPATTTNLLTRCRALFI